MHKFFNQKVKEYRDIPSHAEPRLDDEDDSTSSAFIRGNSSRLVINSDEPTMDYESTSSRNNLFTKTNNTSGSSHNSSIKNMKGIFDDF